MKERFQEALDLVDVDGKLKKTVWGQFWSSHQRFFKYMCMACKVPHVVALAQRALIDNKCVVIGLQSTGEARTLDQLDDFGALSGGEFISTARGVLQNLVEKNFPTLGMLANKSDSSNTNTNSGGGASKNSQRVNEILQRLSTYTNQANVKSKLRRRRKVGRSSSMSSNSSEESSTDRSSPTTQNDSDFDDDDEMNNNNHDESFDSDLGDLDDDDDDDELDDEDDDEDDDEENDEASSSEDNGFSDLELSDENNNKNKNTSNSNNTNKMSLVDDLSASITSSSDTVTNSNNNNDAGFDSDDSDDLFSITKSVSLQSLISMNNLQAAVKKRSMLSGEDNSKSNNNNKRRKTMEETKKERRTSPVVMDFIPKRAQRSVKPTTPHEISEYIYELKSDLLIAIQRLGRRLPPNTLDQLIDMLEGPDNVAEMTGRKGRVVHKPASSSTNQQDVDMIGQQGTYVYESRNETDVPVELMNVMQKERFMNGDKLIAIISEAASSGISLQANR